jgi:hypothetical protein
MKKRAPLQLKSLAEKYIEEFLKCRENFEHFCRFYVFLELPGKDQLMNPYRKQLELIDLIERNRYVLVLKSRQIGISTIIQAYAAWLTVFYDNVVVGLISKDGKEATDFARSIRGIIEKLPDWMKPPRGMLGRGFAKRTEQSFILTNGSKVFASTVNPNAPDKTLRGKAITLLVIDEAAFVNHIDTAWTSLVPALSTNQMQARKAGIPYGTVVLSTPNKTIGVGQWYFQRYLSSISKDDIFTPFIIHWKMIKELAEDATWYKTQCSLFDNDPRRIAQELELKFLPAEGSFFEAETVERMQDSVVEPIETMRLFNGEVWKFAQPIPDRYYIMGVDTAPEHGRDKSAITIWDYQTMEQVWEYQGKLKVMDFIKVVEVGLTQYPGLVVVESNSYGNQVVESLNASEFSIMLYKEKRGKNTFVPGLSTNPQTRPLMIDALYSYLTEFPEIVKSKRLALELTGLVSKKSGKVEADIGCTDDIALATACCMYVRKYDPPLLIDSSRYVGIANEMYSIINMNQPGNRVTFEDHSILKKVKDDNKSGFVDTFSIMRG